jgi:hypothetical protein
MFASFKQLNQVAKLFLDAWAIPKVHGQSKIYCAHELSCGKTEKEKCKCLFEICYIPQGRSKKTTLEAKPVVFLLVKITGCVYEHK